MTRLGSPNKVARMDLPPRLPGARCVGLHELFDGATTADIEAATLLCADCPCLSLCGAWADGRRDLTGVWGGRMR